MEASELEREADGLPAEETLLALARRRLASELRSLPPPGSPGWRAALLAPATPEGASFGALAHGIRLAVRAGRMDETRDIFVALLRRIDGLNRRWVASALWRLPLSAEERHERAQDLAQDLTLLLWEQIVQRDNDAWELFFQRALAFAQRHVAATYLRRQGLAADPRVRHPERGLAIVFSRLVDANDDEDGESIGPAVADAAAFTRAELSDLRALVAQLPARERLAVVMRFWQQASEDEIAQALGGVTTRAVRYTLRRAYRRLRAWYAGEDGLTGDLSELGEGNDVH